ncbi:uncharacterized protein LOC144646642 [Oculina patagonica]
MASERTVIPSLAALVVLCLFVTGMYKLYGDNTDLMISRRSLSENQNKTAHVRFKFPNNYHATGRLFLPHSNIVEPFEIWFTSDFNRSRIDYYYGTDKTYQRADLGKYGVTFKVVPMYTEKNGNYIGCWNLEGHKGWPIIPQPIVPNMTYFKYAGEEVYMGTPATKWEYRYLAFGLLNTHTLLVSKLDPIRPVRYEMKGYDSLMASYYDNYVLEYISFEDWKPDLEKFELPKDQWCYNWSHSLDSHFVSNPMGEFMSYGEDIVDEMYHVYKQHHNKIHDSNHEHVKRKHIFRHNMRYIRSINRQNLTYKLAPNHLVDLTDEEYDGHAGANEDNNTLHKGGVHLEEHHEAYSNMTSVLKTIDVPDELDWRDYGAVTPVRGQGICGSCYALGAVGSVEGAYFMKTGQLEELSAQQIIDCSWGSGNHGCRGGWYNKALSWIYLNGVAKAKNYGPYLAQEGTCETIRLQERIKIDAFAFVPKYNNSALKRAIAKYGPACVSINQKPLSLKFYSWGIYDNPECDNSSTRHTVLVVGYGKENGVPYWLVKNSWSASWGIDGYIKLAWKGNICGVTKNPVVALMKHNTFQFPVKEKVNYVNPLDPISMGRKIHAQHRPGFHRNINDSSLLNSSNHTTNKSNVPEKSEQNASSSRSSLNPHEVDKNGEKLVKRINSSANTETNAFNAEKVKVHKNSEKVVKMGYSPIKKKTEEISTKEGYKNTDKSVKMNTLPFADAKTDELNAHNVDKNADETFEISTSPVQTRTNEPYTSYDAYRGGDNFVSYNTQGNNEMITNQESVYNTPEETENVLWNKKSSTSEPQYFIPSYAYNTYSSYPAGWGTQEAVIKPSMDAISPYDENFAVQDDPHQWIPSERTALEVNTASDNMRTIVEDSPSSSLQKPYKLLNDQDEEPIWTTNQPTPHLPTTASKPTKKVTKASSKDHLKRKVKNRPITTPSPPHITAKPVRHYSGKLQDIYDKLERVIASSLKKNRRLRG